MTCPRHPLGILVPTACALALVGALGCEAPKAPPPADAGAAAAKPTTATPAVKDPLAAKLVAGAWAGMLDGRDPLEITFASGRDGLSAQLRFTRFGRSLVREHAKVTVEPPATVRLKGTRATPLVGKGPAPLHEVTATLAADGTSLSGTTVTAGAPKGVPFTATTTKKLAEVDPPLDVARAEAALVEGKWEGKAGDEPAKLAVTRQGARLTGRFTHAGTIISADVKVQPDGVVTLTAQPYRSGTKLITASFEVAFARLDLGEVSGTLKVVTQLGAMMQGQSYALSLQDRKPKKKGK